MSDKALNTVESAFSYGLNLATPCQVHEGGVPYAVIPSGTRLESLEKFMGRPRTIVHQATFTRSQSLIAFGLQFKNEAMTVAFDEAQVTFQVVVDDHLPSQPSWRSHIGTLQLAYSPEAKAWIEGTGKSKARDQEEFALFIEDHLLDITSPKGTDVLGMVLNFKTASTASFSRAVRLNDGTVQLAYSVDNKPGEVSMPEKMTIHIPIFNGQHRTDVELRVRYRIQEAKLVLWYEIINFERIKRQAIEEYVAAVEEGIGLPVLFRKV
jgi:uncharacterized protein YfdQ (DUF2303 family)